MVEDMRSRMEDMVEGIRSETEGTSPTHTHTHTHTTHTYTHTKCNLYKIIIIFYLMNHLHYYHMYLITDYFIIAMII